MKAALLALAVSLAGCAGQRDALVLSTNAPLSAADYEEVLARWTRSYKVYELMASVLWVHATFHSPEFRRAFLLRHTDIYGRGSEEAKRVALTSEGAEEFLEFFVSAWTNDEKWNDFDQPDSIWRVSLSGPGDEAEQVDGKITRIKTTANLRVIYPYVTGFARTYSVRFPRTTPSGEPILTSKSTGFVLRIRSGLGKAEMEWKLKPTQ